MILIEILDIVKNFHVLFDALGWYLLLQFILAYWCGLLTGSD